MGYVASTKHAEGLGFAMVAMLAVLVEYTCRMNYASAMGCACAMVHEGALGCVALSVRASRLGNDVWETPAVLWSTTSQRVMLRT